MKLQLRSLHEQTSALPLVEAGVPELPYGRDTGEAIQTGVCRGIAGAVRGLVEGYATHLNRWPQVVATGGDLALMKPYVDFIDTFVADLTLRGIGLAYTKHLRDSAHDPDNRYKGVLSTPPGAGAIGIVRIVGSKSVSIARKVFRPLRAGPCPITPGRLRFGSMVVAGECLDDILVSSSSVRGEQVVDLCAHGGIRVLELLLETLAACGAELVAEPKETPCPWPVQDLIQYEAACGLASARTERAARFLARQFSTLPTTIRAMARRCTSDRDRVGHEMGELLDAYPRTRRLVTGTTVAIIGAANGGKSTLFNRLVGREANIVSSTPGTTRDWVCEPIEVGGVAVDLIDTAGIRQHDNRLERAAVSEGQQRAAQADLRLLVLDGSSPLPDRWQEILEAWLELGPVLLVRTKADLLTAWSQDDLRRRKTTCLSVSAQCGDGLDKLVNAIEHAVSPCWDDDSLAGLFTDRQANLLQQVRTTVSTQPVEAARLIGDELLGIGWNREQLPS